jgi:multidrug transporter EmrE-like cation transporter
MNVFYIVVVIGVILSAYSQILLKKSTFDVHKSKIYTILNAKVLVAYSIFFIVLFVNIVALKFGVAVKDMPILESLGYVFVPIFSYLSLSEKLAWKNILPILLIIVGIIIFYL